MLTILVVLAVLAVGVGVTWFVLKRNSPAHLATVETDIKAVATTVVADVKAEVAKVAAPAPVTPVAPVSK